MADRLTIARDWVLVTGPDAATFLQGQLSQDVAGLAPGAPWTYSLLLAPTGKVDAWLGVNRLEDEVFLLDTDPGWGAAVVARLERFKLRTKATVEPVTGWRCTAPAADVLDRTLGLPRGTDADIVAIEQDAAADRAAYEVARIEQGIPQLGAELTGDTIPAEAGAWLIERSVSFTKGCYTGQELVARIDSRGGNVPRLVRGVVADDDDAGTAPAPGAEVLVDDKAVGVVTSAATSSRFGSIGLAVVHRSVEPPASARLGNGTPVRVVGLPFA